MGCVSDAVTPLPMVYSVPMGTEWVIVLALALCCAIGVGSALGGLYFGVQAVQRDEGRYSDVIARLEEVDCDRAAIRLEWGKVVEQLEDIAGTIETRRRRVAASESRQRRNGELQQEPQPELTPAQVRNELRKRLRPVA